MPADIPLYTEKQIKTAKAEGADSKLCNESEYRNPYEEGSRLWYAWQEGYQNVWK